MRNDVELFNLAIQLRNTFGEDYYSPVDVFGLVSLQRNMTIVTLQMPDYMSGMCVKSDGEIIIAINTAMSLGRQRFTLAHELYHAYYDESLMSYVCMKEIENRRSESEKEADKFASFFLAPLLNLDRFQNSKASGIWDIQSIVTAEQFYGISHQAMLVRLVGENRIKQHEYEEYRNISVMKVAEKMGFPLDLYRNTLRSRQYSCSGSYLRKIREAYDRGLIGDGKKTELLMDGFAEIDNNTGDLIDD